MPEPRRILIVEDEPRLRELLLDVLPGMGYDPVAASTAEAALRLLDDQPADIIMLDLNLPAMDGMTFLERLRSRRPGTPATPVIIMTAFGNLENARRAIHLDVVDFLAKPCHLGEIEAALDRARRRLDDSRDATAAVSPSVPNAPRPDAATLADLERDAIFESLRRHAGNRSAAALELGISRRTLYNKLDQYERQGHPTPH